ncbi:MAG TPA: flagellar hook-associated protein FlgL [Rhodocyclaceae bacterium]|nr:flagellar hook-associated protein FlgL [Rhodocyclaceae bacterium]
MRISSTQYHRTMNSTMQSASSRLEEIIQKMSNGQKLLVPSDDPVTHVRVSRLTREEAALTQYRDNIGALKVRLQQNESSLTGMNNDLLEARDLMVWALDGANTSEDVAAMSTSLTALAESLFYSANSKDQEGRYVFSGTVTGSPAVTYDAMAPVGSRYSFTGNIGKQNVVVGNGVTQSANVTVEEVANMLNLLEGTVSALQTPGVDVNDPVTRPQLTATLQGIDVTMGSLSSKVASIGGLQNILDAMDSNHANVSLSNKQALIDLGQLDYGDAAVKLNGYTTALQATQKAYAQVSKLSLFDIL